MAQFFSTRNDKERVSGSKAIIHGIASDGGLYVPEKFENIYKECMEMDNYSDVCNKVLSSFFPEIGISEQVEMAYSKFSENPPVIIKKAGDFNVMELYHGPTCAFKDFALSVLPHLVRKSKEIEIDSNNTVILAATSGDTGKAALEAFSNKDTYEKDIQIVVLYPQNGVSDIQKRQMITQEGSNVNVIGINGNFDDAQSAVKDLFADKKLRELLMKDNLDFSSANSINIGRLIPQIAYYFYSYTELVARGEIKEGEKVSFCVPTGNFGDILAGYYAKKMGLPVYRLICASNENDVLTDFFKTGIYNKKRQLLLTASPSMDILISSNLERLLYHISASTNMVSKWMDQLEKQGFYCIFGDDEKFNEKIKKELEIFIGFSSSHALSQETIHKTYKKYGYLMDTHSSVAYSAAEEIHLPGKTIVLSTASPFKFAPSVCEALGLDISGLSEFEILDLLSSKTGVEIPGPLRELEGKEVIHNLMAERSDIKEVVTALLKRQ